jgi:hypothetical protein
MDRGCIEKTVLRRTPSPKARARPSAVAPSSSLTRGCAGWHVWAVSCRNVPHTERSMPTVDCSLQVRLPPTSVGAVSWGQEEWSAAGAGEHTEYGLERDGRRERPRVRDVRRGGALHTHPSLCCVVVCCWARTESTPRLLGSWRRVAARRQDIRSEYGASGGVRTSTSRHPPICCDGPSDSVPAGCGTTSLGPWRRVAACGHAVGLPNTMAVCRWRSPRCQKVKAGGQVRVWGAGGVWMGAQGSKRAEINVEIVEISPFAWKANVLTGTPHARCALFACIARSSNRFLPRLENMNR